MMAFAIFLVALLAAGLLTSYVYRKLNRKLAVQQKPFGPRLLLTLLIIIVCTLVCFGTYGVIGALLGGLSSR